MKKFKFAIMMFFFILFISTIYNVKPALADSNFTFDSVTGTITGFNGTDTDIVIPETIEGTAVKSIGSRAFQNCTGITSVTFPTSLISIQIQAFVNCTGLTSANFPSNLDTIGYEAFYNCTGITSINFPSDSKLTSLQSECFRYCYRLMNVTFPASLNNIGTEAFSGCNSLAYAYFKGNAPTTMGSNVFAYVPQNFVVYYKSTNNDFTSPSWLGYKCEAIQPLTIDTNNPSNGRTNTAYSYNFTSTGGVGVKNYTVTDGVLPAELTLSTDGKLSGTPTSAGTSNFIVTVTDNDNAVSSCAFSLIILSNDAALSNLTLSSGTLSPEFTGTTTNYTATVGNEVTSITVTPTVNEPNAAVTVNGSSASQPVNLNVGDNTINVVVTAQDGTKKTYTIIVTRASNDASLGNLTLSSGILNTVFTAETTNYTATVGNEVTSIIVTPTVNEANASVTVNGSSASQPVNLNVGANTINVVVTAQDGTTTKTYTITVTRTASNDASLGNLTLSSGILNTVFTAETTNYMANVGNEVTSITVAPTANEANAAVTVNGNPASQAVNLNVGDNTIIVLVTAQDGTTTKTYTITVTRAASSDAALKSLTLSSGTLSPEFTGTATSYTAAVGNEVTSITVTPTVNEANASVTVNGSSPSQPVNLNVGDNIITVLVTAQDGTTKTYTITVTRAASNDAALSSLTLSSGTLSPAFTGETTNYTANVGNEVTSIILTPTANEAYSAVTVNGSPASQTVNLNVGDNIITVLVTAQDGTTNTYTITVTRAAPYVPPYIPPYTPTQPTTETRQVPVLVGNGGQQSTAVQAIITRITGSDGSKKDTLVLDESTAAATVKKALEVKSTTVVIAVTDIPGDNADETEVQIPSTSMTQLANNNMSSIIETGKASLELPAETIKKSKGQDIKVQVSEEKESSKIAEYKGLILQLASGAQVIAAPLNIEANITGRVKITIPIDSSKLPASKEELDKFLSSLAVMVHHSDGENVVDKGTIVYDEKGNVVGISIWVDKFSGFILISLPENYFQGRTTVMNDTVDVDKEWQIKFTKPADAATVTKNNIYVVDSKGIKVEVEISYGSDNLLKVTPIEFYKSGETYYLYITKGVKAKDGTSLVNELRYQFTVK